MSALALDIQQKPGSPVRERNSRMSISELGSSSEGARSYLAELNDMDKTSVTSRLSILASPKSAKLELPPEGSLRPSVRRGSSFKLGRPSGPACSDAARKSPVPHSQPSSPMPNQPTKVYTENEVYEEIRKYEQERYQSDSTESTVGPGAKTETQENKGVVELSDDILLPFADRIEVKDCLFNPQHKHIVDLLKSDKQTWSKVLNILEIPRDVMNDHHWISELKSIIYPKGESLWHRVVMAIGIDAQDAAVTPYVEPTTLMWVEPVHDGDSLIECDRANEARRSQDTTPTMLSPSLPFTMELPGSPRTQSPRLNEPRLGRRHERTASGGSLRSGASFKSPMSSIAEDISSVGGFPEATQPPKKLNYELLLEQERQMAQNQSSVPSSWRGRGTSHVATSQGSFIPPSVETEEDDRDCIEQQDALKRSQSGHSMRSNGDSPTGRRMRGLRFVTCPTGEDPALSFPPHSPSAIMRKDPLSKSLSSTTTSDGCAIETESDEDPYSGSLSRSSSLGSFTQGQKRSSKLRFSFGQQRRGPALLA